MNTKKAIANAIVTELWLGDLPSYNDAFAGEERMRQATPDEALQLQAYSDARQEDEFQGYGYMVSRVNNTAVLDIKGSLITQSSWLSRMFGMTGYDEIRNAAVAAATSEGIDNILLDIDSPGGSTRGLDEAANVLAEIDESVMPVFSYTSGSMASAAYWLGSTARTIYATEMSSVGSIGVLLVHMEQAEAMKDQGIGVTVMSAGKYKTVGNQYEKLDDFDKGVIQTKIDDLYDHFTATVAQNRGLSVEHVRENAAEGQDFWGKDAVGVGLVDGIASFDEVVKLLDTVHNSQQAGNSVGQHIGANAMLRKGKVVMTQAASDAIAAGVPVDAALQQHADPAADTEGTTLEGTATDVVDPATPPTPAAGPAAATEDSTDDTDDTDSVVLTSEASDGTVSLLLDKLGATQADLANRTTELATANAALGSMQSMQASFMDIARTACQRMNVALGGTAVALEGLNAEQLLTQYEATSTEFQSRFPVGGKAEVKVEDQRNSPDDTVVSIAPAIVGATSFRKGG